MKTLKNLIYLIAFIINLFCSIAHSKSPLVMVVGGQAEGEIGDKNSWSYPLYKKFISNGPTHGDGKIKVVIFSQGPDDFYGDYFKSLGATSAETLVVDSIEKANDPKIVDTVADADIVFFRGGDQAVYYRSWKNTRLHEHFKKIAEKGGAFGGTSAGAMILSEFSLSGGQSLISKDVLKDSHSPLLNDDTDGKTSIHNDFFKLLPQTLIDTHCGERARLGRLLGAQAKAIDDSKNAKILGICIEEKTGLIISDSNAKVFGKGAVHFVQPTSGSELVRDSGHPLIWTDIRDDVLTEGWNYNLKNRLPNTLKIPLSARPILEHKNCEKFLQIKDAQSQKEGGGDNYMRGVYQTQALRNLFDNPDVINFLTPIEEKLVLTGNSPQVSIELNDSVVKEDDVASIVLDCSNCTYKSLSSFISNQDDGSKKLHSAGLINLKLHVLSNGSKFNLSSHDVTFIQKDLSANTSISKCKATSANSKILPLSQKDFLKFGHNLQWILNCEK
jgi:cyanophycinase